MAIRSIGGFGLGEGAQPMQQDRSAFSRASAETPSSGTDIGPSPALSTPQTPASAVAQRMLVSPPPPPELTTTTPSADLIRPRSLKEGCPSFLEMIKWITGPLKKLKEMDPRYTFDRCLFNSEGALLIALLPRSGEKKGLKPYAWYYPAGAPSLYPVMIHKHEKKEGAKLEHGAFGELNAISGAYPDADWKPIFFGWQREYSYHQPLTSSRFRWIYSLNGKLARCLRNVSPSS